MNTFSRRAQVRYLVLTAERSAGFIRDLQGPLCTWRSSGRLVPEGRCPPPGVSPHRSPAADRGRPVS